jgi:hypothetical protein
MRVLRLPNLFLITFSLILLVCSTPSVSHSINGNSTTPDEAEVNFSMEQHVELSNVTWANVTWADKSKF